MITLRGLARATIHSVDTPPGKGYPTAMFTRRLDVQPRRGRTVVKRCLCVCPLFPSLAPREVAGFWALAAMCGHVCAVDCVLCWGLLGDCWKRLRACCCGIGNLWHALFCGFHTAGGEEGSERVNTLMVPFRVSISKFLQVSRHAPPPAPPPLPIPSPFSQPFPITTPQSTPIAFGVSSPCKSHHYRLTSSRLCWSGVLEHFWITSAGGDGRGEGLLSQCCVHPTA